MNGRCRFSTGAHKHRQGGENGRRRQTSLLCVQDMSREKNRQELARLPLARKPLAEGSDQQIELDSTMTRPDLQATGLCMCVVQVVVQLPVRMRFTTCWTLQQ